MDTESESIREVFARYGLALYLAQCVERQLAIAAPMLHGMDPRSATGVQASELLDSLFSKPFGHVIQELERSAGLPAGFEDRLRKARKIRNRLAHNYFWDRAGEFNSTAGRTRMVQELDEDASFFEGLDAELSAASDSYYRAWGIDDEVRERLTSQLIATGAKA